MSSRARLALVFVSLAWTVASAAGPSELDSLREGRRLGAFRAEARYLDAAGAAKGARFAHERGGVVDVLFFDSVPQVSVNFTAAPDDDRGTPHTLEHLLVGKGAAGRRIQTLIPMRMGQFTAGTYSDVTNYQFSSAAGPEEFYELLDHFLTALIRPDFTDEEVRREVAHHVVLEEGGKPHLEEAGSVYNEMVSRMEQPASVAWDALGRMLFGAGHPLGLNQGGLPERIWELSPADIRAFHAAHYHVDGRMRMIASLPPSWSCERFLERLDASLRRVEPIAPSVAQRPLPPATPQPERGVRIEAFPSKDTSSPQNVLFAWPPVRTLTDEEKVRLDLALDMIAGHLPFLAGDYLDKIVRKASPDAPSVGLSLSAVELPASYAWGQISDVPVAAITAPSLTAMRDAVVERIRWLHDLKAGAPSLAELVEKARPRIRQRRRLGAKYLEGPPKFGERSTYAGWHRVLDLLGAEPGFDKHLDETAILDKLLAELEAGRNPWTAVLARAGLLEPPYVSAARPDAALQERQKRAKVERLAEKARALAAEHGVPAPEALERYRIAFASAGAALEALERGRPKPAFLLEPPLELDRVDWIEQRLPSGPSLVATRFDTPFTDVTLAFDLNGIPEEDRELLPILASAVRGVGVVTKDGEDLDGFKAWERVSEELNGADVNLDADPTSGRTELAFVVHASTASELERALDWLENYVLRPDLSLESRDSLKSSLQSEIQRRRAIFQGDEESWVSGMAAAYRHQHRPMYMHSTSPFTVLRHLNRLRWRLEEPSPARFEVMKATAAAVLQAAEAADRAEAERRLRTLGGELGEYLRWEFAYLPDDSWRTDLRRLVSEYLADLGRAPETIRRLQTLAARVLVRSGARAHANGSPRHVELAATRLDALLARLPAGSPAARPRPRDVVLERLRERIPAPVRPVHAAFVNENGKTGSIIVTAPAPAYRSLGREALLDALALGVLSGAGGHSLYMRTWNAGLAYGNGLAFWPSIGLAQYYADKCPDPSQTVRFAAGVASATTLDDPFFLEYSLADAFGDYRAAQDFAGRGRALANDLADGNRPEVVRAFKAALLKTAREPGALAAVRERFGPVLSRVLPGTGSGNVSGRAGAAAMVIGPESLIRSYEDLVRERGESDRVVRLYPRDFWPPPDTARPVSGARHALEPEPTKLLRSLRPGTADKKAAQGTGSARRENPSALRP